MICNYHFTDKDSGTQKGDTASHEHRWDSNAVLYKVLSREASLPSTLFLVPSTMGGQQEVCVIRTWGPQGLAKGAISEVKMRP